MNKCQLCSASISNRDGLSGHLCFAHQENLDAEILSCSCCQEWFTNLSALENHMMLVHKKNKSDAEKCPHCEKTYLTTAALLQHIICTHLKDQKDNDYYNCPFCPSKLKSISAFRDHIRLHFIKKSKDKASNKLDQDLKFLCPKCPAQLETTEDLSSHLYSFHYNPKIPDKGNEKKAGRTRVAEQEKPARTKLTKSAARKPRKSKKTVSNKVVDDEILNKPSIDEHQKGQEEVVSELPERENLNASEVENGANLNGEKDLQISEILKETHDYMSNTLSLDKPLIASLPPDIPNQTDDDAHNKNKENVSDNRGNKNIGISHERDFDTSDDDVDNPDKGDAEIQSESSSSENLDNSSNESDKVTTKSEKRKRKVKSNEHQDSPFSKTSNGKKKSRSDTNVACPHCTRMSFGSKSGLANHLKWVHKIATPQYICNLCNKKFARNKNLQAHMRTHEKVANQKCPVCNALFISTELVEDHLVDVHKYSLDSVYLTFDTLAEFDEWKRKEEAITVSSFVKRNGTRKFPDGRSVDRFCCHRSGNYIPMGHNRRKLKAFGSNKTGFYCPAKIKLECSPDGIFVTYLKLHLGHSHDLKRLKLSREEKTTVEKKLAENVPFNEILNEVRDGVLEDRSKRLTLLTKKDLYDIAQKYNLTREAMSEASNLEGWINEMRTATNIIRAFKPMGSPLEGHKELNINDFFLVIARDCQLSALTKFGKFIVCFDWIKAIDPCSIHLYTLTVIDDLNESYPCAFLYTNRNDGPSMRVFFRIIRSLCIVKPKYFMCDIADYIFDAWSSVFEPGKTRFLYCNWHLDNAWRTALTSLPQEKQIQIYKNLKIIITENDKEVFKFMCQTLLNQLSQDDQTKSFGAYFKRFVDNPKPWAHCCRIPSHSAIYTTLENMHLVIKCLYLGTGKLLSPDKSISVLMKYLRDLHYERAYPLLPKRNQPTKCNTDHLYSNHKSISSLKVSIIYKSNQTWIVSLGKSASRLYEVSINKDDCNCQLVCRECSFCVHYLRCACIESSIKWIMCGHIHSVGRFLKAQQTSLITEEVQGQDLEFTTYNDNNVMSEVIMDEINDDILIDTVTETVTTSEFDPTIPSVTAGDQMTDERCNSISEGLSNGSISLEIISNERDANDESFKELSFNDNLPNLDVASEVIIDDSDSKQKNKKLKQNTDISLKITLSKGEPPTKKVKTTKRKHLPKDNILSSEQTREKSSNALKKKKSSKHNSCPENNSSVSEERIVEVMKKKSRKHKKSSKTDVSLPIEIPKNENEILFKKKHSLDSNSNISTPMQNISTKNDILVKKKSLKQDHSSSNMPASIEKPAKKRDHKKNKSLVQNSLPNNISKTTAPLELTVNKRGVLKKEKSLKRISLPNKVSKVPVPLETTVNKGDLSRKDTPPKKDKLNRLKEQTFKKFAKLLKTIETQEELELLTKSIPAYRLNEKVKKMSSTIGS